MRPGTSSDAETDSVTRIQCWSGPRNVSTALMCAWRQRADTTVYDEPFYAHYLNLTAGITRCSTSCRRQSTDVSEVIDKVILGPIDTPVYFMKQMAHHLHGVLGVGFTAPRTSSSPVILGTCSGRCRFSFDCGLADTGLVEQVELLDAVLNDGGSPVVIDSRLLLEDPAGVLARVCERLGLKFDVRCCHGRPDPNPKTASGRPPGMRRCTPRPAFRRIGPRATRHRIDSARSSTRHSRSTNDCSSSRPAALVRGHSAATCRTSLRRCGLLRRLER